MAMAANIIKTLLEDDIYLYLEDGQLKYKAKKDALTETHKKLVRENKVAIVDYLQKMTSIAAQGEYDIPPIAVTRRPKELPLSYAQQRLWFLDQLGEGSVEYNMSGHYLHRGNFDECAFKKALHSLITRHEVLRTHFTAEDGAPQQVIKKEFDLPYRQWDLSDLSQLQRDREIARHHQQEIETPFNLSADLMIRIRVLKLQADSHLVFYTLHHIASDGWSLDLFYQELSSLYQAWHGAQKTEMPALKVQYADYAIWQRQWLQGDFLTGQLDYWRQQLTGLPEEHGIPLDRPRKAKPSFAGDVITQPLDFTRSNKIKAVCQQQQVTAFMFLQTVLALLLSRYSNSTDIVMGTTVAGRTHGDLDDLIGFFVNSLVLRTDLSGDPDFKELLQANKDNLLQAFAHQHIPFEMLVEELKPERNLSHNPLFQIMFSVQNDTLGQLDFKGSDSSSDNSVQFLASDAQISTRVDLEVNADASGDSISIEWVYNTALFNTDTIAAMSQRFEVLLDNVLETVWQESPASTALSSEFSRVRISELTCLSEQEQQKLLLDWNQTQCNYNPDIGIHGLFEQQVRQTPDNIAVTFEGQNISYADLNAKANQLAHFLLSRGIKTDDLVGVCLDRTISLIISLLGILKAGAAYVPIDPGYPEERIKYMLQDADVTCLISSDSLQDRLPIEKAKIINLDDSQILASFSPDDPLAEQYHVQGDSGFAEYTAYVIYTSGSTGKPKGVQLTHRNVNNFLVSMKREPGLCAQDVFLAVTSVSFDIHVLELYLPLIVGSKLVVASTPDTRSGRALSDIIARENVNSMQATPTTWRLLMENGWHPEPGFKALCGGEALNFGLKEQLLGIAGLSLWNMYGPTETCVWSSVEKLRVKEKVVLGRPINNTQFYVLNASMELVPRGVFGELYIGGEGVARGYLNQPELTDARFVVNPFFNSKDKRLYRTGDIVRYLPDGKLEYVDRIDNQTKIRGFRIELNEIEVQLSQHDLVKFCVVAASEKQPGDKYLVAYVQLVDGADKSKDYPEAWRNYLLQKLPQYMVPDVYVVLEQVPLTPNGKVDRKSLPTPDSKAFRNQQYVAPETRTEKSLAGIWSTILGIDATEISITANFFSMGGHSLLATRLLSAIHKAFQVELPLSDIFEFPTIEQQCARLQEQNTPLHPTGVQQIDRSKPIPLSYAQQRLWFIHQMGDGSAQYNMPGQYRLQGEFNLYAFKRAFTHLLQRHEVLRTYFVSVDGEPRQVISQNYELPLTQLDLSELNSHQQQQRIAVISQRELQTSFDLSKDLMVRMQILTLSDTEHLILYTLHHIACDGWSLSIFNQELSALYHAFCVDAPDPLPPCTLQYADYAVWQKQWLQGDVLSKQLDYWKEQLAGIPLTHNLTTDQPREAIQSYEGIAFQNTINSEKLQCIKDLCKEQDVTLFIFLQTAFAVLISRFSNERDIVIGSPIAGRTQSDLENMIGFFVNSLILRTQIDTETQFRDLLQSNKQNILDAFANQHVPFEMLVEEMRPERNLSFNSLFQIIFAMHNMEQNQLELNGVDTLNEQGEADVTGQANVTTRFDIELHASEEKGGLSFVWIYNKALFEHDTATRMASSFKVLLDNVIRQLQRPNLQESPITRLELMNNPAQMLMLADGHGLAKETASSYSSTTSNNVVVLFEEQVTLHPHQLALIFDEKELTFQELNHQANALAYYLLDAGVGDNDVIGLCIERSVAMVVSLLAILKTGAAYLPLEPTQPIARRNFMVGDSNAKLLIGTGSSLRGFTPDNCELVVVDDRDTRDLIAANSTQNPELALHAENLAYIIYTSGSTGKPKGVMVNHGNLWNYLQHGAEYLDEGVQGALVSSALVFDATVCPIYIPLCHGKYIELINEQDAVVDALTDYLIDDSERLLFKLTPSHLKAILNNETLTANNKVNHILVLGGEALSTSLLLQWQQRFPGSTIINEYGPTEATVGCCIYTCEAQSNSMNSAETLDVNGAVPIGYPIQNTQLLVLNNELSLQPVGVPGELFIAGEGVTQGYMNKGGLTAERFIPNIYSAKAGDRLYRTGDIVRWLPEGGLEYLGRSDNQVKIRGHRIEIGEVESAIAVCDYVNHVVVTPHHDDNQDAHLVAYVCPTTAYLDECIQLNTSDNLSQWTDVFNDTYRDSTQTHAVHLNYAGWDSSYTMLPIATEQMDEWLRETLRVIDSLQPKNLLEIGCGTGLLLFRYAEQCDSVLAVDISQSALSAVQEGIEQKDWQHIQLLQGDALNIAAMPADQKFDTIVVNSVAQYFPNQNYLEKVLKGLFERLEDGGRILLGDIRNLDLFEAHVTLMERSRLTQNISARVLSNRIQRRIQQEQELLVSPGFFSNLASRIPQISKVDIQVKRGVGDNEMSRYRYEVILTKSTKSEGPQANHRPGKDKHTSWFDFTSREALTKLLNERDIQCFGVAAVPNGKVVEDVDLYTRLKSVHDNYQIEPMEHPGSYSYEALLQVQWLEETLQLAEALGYYCAATWSQEDLAKLDLIFSKSPLPEIKARTAYKQTKPCNYPQLSTVGYFVSRDLKAHLDMELPTHMIPGVFVTLQSMPTTVNGKVDIKALPKPHEEDLQKEAYVAPRNEIEETLCHLWQNILQLKKISVFDNFFSLGGHSLLATRLISAVREAFAAELPLQALFNQPTVAEMAELLVQGNEEFVLPPIKVTDRVGNLPISFAQQRLWFIDQLGEGSAHYNMSGNFVLKGAYNQQAFETALGTLIERQEVLKTCFKVAHGEPAQYILSDYAMPLTVLDISEFEGVLQEQKLHDLLQAEAVKPFNLSSDIMIRVLAIRLNSDETFIFYTLHHVVSDGWSMDILKQELLALYHAYKNNKENPLKPLPIQYADYAIWQRDWLQGDVLKRQFDFWQTRLADLPPIHSLPLDKPRPAKQSFRGKCHAHILDKALTGKIKLICKEQEVTLFMFLQTAFALLLGRYSNQTDIVMGIATGGRTHKDVEDLIGFFVNSIVLRTELSEGQSFDSLLKQNKQNILDAYSHQHIPFEMLVEEISPERDLSHNPIFQIMFGVERVTPQMQSQHSASSYEELARQIKDSHHTNSTTRSDLQVHVNDLDELLGVRWNYNESLFAEQTLSRLADSYEALLQSIILEFERKTSANGGEKDTGSCAALNMLSEEQIYNLTHQWQGKAVEFPRTKTLHQLFEEQAVTTPDNIAVRIDGEGIAYRELNERANRLARYLKVLGAKPNEPIALCVEPSLEMMVAMLAILKSGAPYIPLDPGLPEARFTLMLEDCQCKLVLTQQELMTELNFAGCKQVPVDLELLSLFTNKYSSENLCESDMNNSEALAYILYTSGSSGKPKGVMVSHKAVVAYCSYAQQSYYNCNLSGAIALTNFNVDMTVPGLYLPLLNGGTMQLLGAGITLEQLTTALRQAKQNLLLRMTPSHVSGLLSLMDNQEALPQEHVFVLGGEMLHMTTVNRLRRLFPKARIMNHYGPTEAVVGCVLNQYVHTGNAKDPVTSALENGSVPIGKPMDNTRLFILDEHLNLQLPGAIGELAVGGASLANGYWADEKLTEQKFIANPFNSEHDETLYLTGDLVRWLPDGDMAFVGRKDAQVKVRGFRIELGDIESALKDIDGIRDLCVVISTVSGNQARIIAYLVPTKAIEGEDDLEYQQEKEKRIRQYNEKLAESLPDYMLPSVYVFLDEMPLTSNGKIHKMRLPEPQESDLKSEKYEAPRTNTEARLCAIWQQILRLERVGINDNFFNLGGHSLLATKLISCIRQEFETELPLRMVFEFPMLAELSDLIETQLLERRKMEDANNEQEEVFII